MRFRRSRNRKSLFIPEVSLTPLVDTALTLLIIFMITAPMLRHAIKVELPKGSLQEGGKQQQELVVSIDPQGTIYFNKSPVSLEQLGHAVQEYLAQHRASDQKSVWLHVDGKATNCDTLVAVIDQIKSIGGVKDVNIALQKTARTLA